MEIEKRYKIIGDIPFDLAISKEYIEQGYSVISDGKNTPDVRIRKLEKDGNIKYFHTVKYPTDSKFSRIEIEDIITEDEYNAIKGLLNSDLVKKNRYIIPLNNGLMAEVDEFLNRDKVIVEVEFDSEDKIAIFESNKPKWIGEDITGSLKFVKVKINNRFYFA